jgi:hypothetical protein
VKRRDPLRIPTERPIAPSGLILEQFLSLGQGTAAREPIHTSLVQPFTFAPERATKTFIFIDRPNDIDSPEDESVCDPFARLQRIACCSRTEHRYSSRLHTNRSELAPSNDSPHLLNPATKKMPPGMCGNAATGSAGASTDTLNGENGNGGAGESPDVLSRVADLEA